MKRRGFLAAMLAAGAAPAIVQASSIMRITPPRIIVPGIPVGTLQAFMPTIDPGHIHASVEHRILSDAGWLRCDGSVISRTLYPALAGVIGGTYGMTGPAEFALPDLRDQFQRSFG